METLKKNEINICYLVVIVRKNQRFKGVEINGFSLKRILLIYDFNTLFLIYGRLTYNVENIKCI
jgi:hypothetical protein